MGRNDFQVKIRGFRIELGEIDATLTRHDDVDFAVTVGHRADSGASVLVSYLRPAPGRVIDADAVSAYAAQRLPAYMVPTALVVLDGIPLTPAGKLDRRALPAPEFTAREFRAPSGPIEELVADIFADLLGIDRAGGRVGADDDFFVLGGNSLIATQVTARLGAALGAEVGVRALFEASTVAGLAALVGLQTGSGARLALSPQQRPERPPLSLAQQRMWFLNRFDSDSAANNIPVAVQLRGELDLPALRGAVADIVSRHESLRTIYPSHDGVGYQRVLPAASAVPEIQVIDTLDERDTAALVAAIAEFAEYGFDVTTEPPVRMRIYRNSPVDHILVVVAHHIAADGFSMRPLVRDLMTAYLARTADTVPAWPPLPIQYVDYALWQRDVLGSEEDPRSLISAQLDYWRTALAGLPDELRLSNRPRPAVASYAAGTHRFQVPAHLVEALSGLARAQQTTLFMVVHGAFATLLSRLSGTDDIAIGIPVAGRGEQALDDLVGMVVNTLVLRSEVDPATSFTDLLASVRERDLAAFAQAGVPFERLVEVLNPARSQGRHPLFQVMLTFQNTGTAALELPGLTVSEMRIDAPSAKFDLQLTLTDSTEPGADAVGMDAELVYATDLFDAGFAKTFATRLLRVLEAVAADPAITVGDIEVLDPAERALIVRHWNETSFEIDAALPRSSDDPAETLISLFEAQVARTPEAAAISFEGTSLSYAEFAGRVRQLARWLIAEGVGPESVVALGLRRSIDLVAGIYAVVAAGGAYLPLDPDHPAERIGYIVETARPAVLLSSSGDRAAFDDAAGLSATSVAAVDELELSRFAATPLTDDDRLAPLHPSNTAYVLFTSGSTGRPKGVAVPHSRDRQPAGVDAAPSTVWPPTMWCCRRRRRPSTCRSGSSSGRCRSVPAWWSPSRTATAIPPIWRN